jgi:hypothetical protein
MTRDVVTSSTQHAKITSALKKRKIASSAELANYLTR